jgi:hypothetical protein
MPAGDPAGYLPNVIKKRLKKVGTKNYRVRAKRPVATIKVPRQPLKNAKPAPAAPQAPPLKKPGPGPRVPVANTPAQFKARSKKLTKLKPRFSSAKGARRLNFKDAYLRRSTPESQARVETLYGKKAGAKLKRKADGPKARYFGRSK